MISTPATPLPAAGLWLLTTFSSMLMLSKIDTYLYLYIFPMLTVQFNRFECGLKAALAKVGCVPWYLPKPDEGHAPPCRYKHNGYNTGTNGFEKNLSLQFEKDGRVPEKFEQGDELSVLSLSS